MDSSRSSASHTVGANLFLGAKDRYTVINEHASAERFPNAHWRNDGDVAIMRDLVT